MRSNFCVLSELKASTAKVAQNYIELEAERLDDLTAGGKLIHKDSAPNPICAANQQAAELPSDVEDNHSIGLLITWGKFRMLDLAP